MNTSGTCVLLTSEDVFKTSRPLVAQDAAIGDFAIPREIETTAAIIQFVDDYGNTRILKNRFGRRGMVQP